VGRLAIIASPVNLNLEEPPPMPTRNVSLTEHSDLFIESGVSSGRFSNASEVVREGLRLLEQREQEDKASGSFPRRERECGRGRRMNGIALVFRIYHAFGQSMAGRA